MPMYFLPYAVALGVSVSITLIIARKLYPEWVKKRAIKTLDSLLFPKGNRQKNEVLKTFNAFTADRFNDEEILDYFFKIKGLQSVEINKKTNFWVKKYLFSPTTIKLNYFEQVKFYETFLNYPESPKTAKKSFFKPEKFSKQKIKSDYAPRMSKNIV